LSDVRREIALQDATADEAFQAGLRALAAAGFDLWKTRPLGWFAIARRKVGTSMLEANLSVRKAGETRVSLGLNGDDVDEAVLAGIASDILRGTEEQLGRGAS